MANRKGVEIPHGWGVDSKGLVRSVNNTHYNPSNIFARARLVKTRHVTQYAPTKIGEYPSDIPQFK